MDLPVQRPSTCDVDLGLILQTSQVDFSIWCGTSSADKYEMRRGRFAKDGLIQYRIEEALEEALDVDDLEADKRPEDLMPSYVGGEKGKDRSDCDLVTPWFKFLWETCRTVLEILRNNSKLEAFYAMTVYRAFSFEAFRSVEDIHGFSLDPKRDSREVIRDKERF
ncbi:hypothetical protein MKW98_030762 [Papaver atlanticum]|uniref:eIF3a PCI domain-containing protein n=1 Tax=Papaver atlanticum TaxID=357466 RepID=A0AAD4X706_9MAGN|nr:hypothetical protein MKW98_030762 [Papaver atlanticum]